MITTRSESCSGRWAAAFCGRAHRTSSSRSSASTTEALLARPGASGWRLDVARSADLPPLAWVLRAANGAARLYGGELVGSGEWGAFEGTWVGDAGPAGILASTTTFGSGVLRDGEDLVILPPSHMLEAVYVHRRQEAVIASNSMVGLLVAAQLELDPTLDYPFILGQTGDGIFRFSVPTLSEPFDVVLYEGLRLRPDGSVQDVARPRERDFADYTDYRRRLQAALASAIANAPDDEPLATISSGYDSAAMATLAAELGVRRAITIADGKPVRGSDRISDSGELVGARLGLDVKAYRRLTYMQRDDLIEADFLAGGMTGEDVILSAAEDELRRRLLITGYLGDGMWWLNRPKRPLMWRLDQTGQSHTEFRLRVGYIHVPLPWFGASQIASVGRISQSAEMRPFVLGMDNDRPVPRRILETAGIPRGSFADAKRAPSATLHQHGPEAMGPTSRAALAEFAARDGRALAFRRRRAFPRWRRAVLKVAKRLHQQWLLQWAERPRRSHQRHQPEFGNLLLRWAVEVVRPRYAAVARSVGEDHPE